MAEEETIYWSLSSDRSWRGRGGHGGVTTILGSTSGMCLTIPGSISCLGVTMDLSTGFAGAPGDDEAPGSGAARASASVRPLRWFAHQVSAPAVAATSRPSAMRLIRYLLMYSSTRVMHDWFREPEKVHGRSHLPLVVFVAHSIARFGIDNVLKLFVGQEALEILHEARDDSLHPARRRARVVRRHDDIRQRP